MNKGQEKWKSEIILILLKWLFFFLPATLQQFTLTVLFWCFLWTLICELKCERWKEICLKRYKKKIYILPDDYRECDVLYDNYVSTSLLRDQVGMLKYVFKVFGLPLSEVNKRLDKLPKLVQRSCNTDNMDRKTEFETGWIKKFRQSLKQSQ